MSVNDKAKALRKLFPTKSSSFRDVLTTAEKVLDHDVNVLILGESGVGKDFLAEALHRCSNRAANPFVQIDCANLPSDIFESELFGYEKGAFTDAQTRKIGKIELAHRGTLYLDEVGTLTSPLQAKLLRVVQERKFSRLGGNQVLDIDARFISSSNLPLEVLLGTGAFRNDLFYRLNVITLNLPPLRLRRGDVPMLAARFLEEAAGRVNKRIRGFEPAVSELLSDHSWPGNLRELRHVIERAAILEETDLITQQSMPFENFVEASHFVTSGKESRWTLEELEKRYIREILRQTAGNFSKAADVLGINRKTLLEKRKKYGLE